MIAIVGGVFTCFGTAKDTGIFDIEGKVCTINV